MKESIKQYREPPFWPVPGIALSGDVMPQKHKGKKVFIALLLRSAVLIQKMPGNAYMQVHFCLGKRDFETKVLSAPDALSSKELKKELCILRKVSRFSQDSSAIFFR